jgi:hypothetical protein
VKKLMLAGALSALFVTAAFAAEKLEDKSLKLSLQAPETFIASPQLPEKDNFIGTAKGLYLSPDVQKTGGALLVHHMDLPGGADYPTVKAALEPQLAQVFGTGYRLVKQEDIKLDGFTGFTLEFICPGDGTKPMPGGTTPHHIRWYFLKDGDAKLVGILYGAQDAAWKDLEPKYAASFKTLKRTE